MTRLLVFIGIPLFFVGCQNNQKKTESISEKEAVATTTENLLSSEEKKCRLATFI